MRMRRFIAWIFLLIAGAVLVRDALLWNDLHVIAPLSLGGLWSDLAPDNFRAARQAIESAHPALWHWLVGPLLSLWALPVLLILGLPLLGTRRRPRRHRFR
jgi:hypothetical protein